MMALIALLAFFVFYGNYLLRQFILRLRGIKANRLGRGEKPASARVLEYALLGATYALAGLQIASILFRGYMLPADLPFPLRLLGTALSWCGAIVFILATNGMRENWRAGVDATQRTDMVTGGAYRFCRNPAFLGFDLFYLGVALAQPTVPLLVITPLGVLLLHLQILQEERYLARVFGEAYRDYKAKVKRYCPLF